MVSRACFAALVSISLAIFGDAESYIRVSIAISGAREECAIERGFRRPGLSTYQLVFTSTTEECCRLCQLEPDCKSWSYSRRDGACGLKAKEEPLVVGEGCDSGVVGGTPVKEEVIAEFPCPTEQGVDRPGYTFREEVTESEDACCRVCEGTVGCYSWAWEIDSRVCELKNGLPRGRARKGFSSGPIL